MSDSTVAALWVAEPALRWASAEASGTVIGVFGHTVHVEAGGEVIAVQPADAPRMPNGVGVEVSTWPESVAPGRSVELTSRGLILDGIAVSWSGGETDHWDPAVARWPAEGCPGVAERGAALARLGAPSWSGGLHLQEGASSAKRLIESAANVDPDIGAAAASRLIGLGGGLTPVGDDVIAATALTILALGEATGRSTAETVAWIEAVVPAELERRTIPVSVTLLRLAADGDAIGPAAELLDPGSSDSALASAAAELSRIGHSTGRAYVNTIGAVALALTGGPTTVTQPEEELSR